MKTICITGSIQDDLNCISEILATSGMAGPKPGNRDVLHDIAFWHEQAMAGVSEACDCFAPIAGIGRVWEQFASDIFVANVASPLWGWADTNSIRFLDFWSDFEPRLNFLLVSISPEYMLARNMEGNVNTLSISDILVTWLAQQQELLRFYHRHPDRTLLVNVNECAEHPSALVQLCASRWNMPLAAPGDLPSQALVDPFALYVGRQLCREYPRIMSLAHELEATVIRLDEGKQADTIEELPPELIITGFRRLRDRSAELQRIAAAQTEIASLVKNLEAQERLVTERQAELDMATQQLAGMPSRIEGLEGTKQKIAASEEKLEAVIGENELLLLQLHQVQEELECLVLQQKKSQEEISTLQESELQWTQKYNQLSANTSALFKEHSELKTLFIERQTVVDTLAKERDAQKKLAAERQATIDDLIKERDAQAELANDRQSQLSKIQQDIVEANNQAKRLEDKMIGLNENEGKLKEISDENELLLLQLRQVQRELEHYFLQHQEAQKLLRNSDNRWKHILQRCPDYCDYENVSVFPAQRNDPSVLSWCFHEMSIAGRHFSEFQVDIFMEEGVAGFRFNYNKDKTSPLLRWPVGSGNQEAVTILPVATPENRQTRLATLINLASSDWRLIQILAKLLCEIIRLPNPMEGLEEAQRELFLVGLERFLSIISTFPAVFRYDQVELKHEQVNPGYEHLWLCLKNLALNENLWPQFEFRLSCANVSSDSFGTHPKLEFPESTGELPFESWFKESSDDFGSKLELRFALLTDMDMEVWQRLSGNDKSFLFELSKHLTCIIGELQNQKVRTSRSWDDWLRLAQDVHRILNVRSAAG